MLWGQMVSQVSKWRSRRKRRWTKTVFHTVLSLFWCIFLLVSLCSSCCFTQKLRLLLQLHYPQPRASCSNTWRSPTHEMSYMQSSKEALGPQGQPGGAGLSGALIAGRVNECVCHWVRPRLTTGVVLFSVEIRAANVATPPIPVRRERHMRTLKTILAQCLFGSPWDASHSSFSLNLKILCHFLV